MIVYREAPSRESKGCSAHTHRDRSAVCRTMNGVRGAHRDGAIELVRIIHELVMPKLRRQDSELHQQLHRAVRSVVLRNGRSPWSCSIPRG